MFRAVTICVLGAALLTGCNRNANQPGTPTPPPTPTVTPTPTPVPTPKPPTPEPTPYVPNKELKVGTMFNGITYKVNLETIVGTTATAERSKQDSYTVEVSVKVDVPKPHTSLEELRKLNDKLDKALPGLAGLLVTARVSPDFDDLYRTKVNSLKASLNRLDSLLTRHNFYDCETILELRDPTTKRRALLIQADMDVDTDGTDGDRLYAVSDNNSRTFQPFTSYRWDKKSPNPNPCVAVWEKRVTDLEAKLKEKGADTSRLKADLSRLRVELRDLGKYSYLIGVADPFVVLPTSMFGSLKEGPSIGDYCVVIVGDTLYPAIVGDAGPIMKIGEASLRICKQVSPQSNGNYRPVSELKATYLVFPGTAERPMVSPDYTAWRNRCQALLNEIGGWQGELYDWPDITKPAVPPPPPPPPPETTNPPTGTPAAPAGTPTSPPGTTPTAPAGTTPPAPTPGNAPPATPAPTPASGAAPATPPPAPPGAKP